MTASVQSKKACVSAVSGSHTSITNITRIAMLSEISKKGGLDLRAPIDMLPDDVLLEIFEHDRLSAELFSWLSEPWEWHRLAHVCGRWRTIIFGSPHRLKLRLVYTYKKPARKNIDCWPYLPLSIRYPASSRYHLTQTDEENIIAALGHPDCICEIDLLISLPLFEKLAPLMRDPFPMLETLELASPDDFVVPSTFLGGSAPQLRRICLIYTPFPTLPQFLSTAPALVSFSLCALPTIEYIPPDTLVAGLDAKPKLEILHIDWSTPNPGQQSPRAPYPQTRVILPALTQFRFTGDNEYLEDLVSRIDTPNIEQLHVALLDHRIFEFPQLAEFIGRTKHLTSSPHRMSIRLCRHSCDIIYYFTLPFPSQTFELKISCDESTGHIKPLTHACRQLSQLLSNVELLDIEASEVLSDWCDKPDTVQWLEWLECFSLFGAVRILELVGELIPFAASALEQSGNMGYGTVLPSLEDLFMRGRDYSAPQMESFRRRSDRIVSIHYTGVGDEDHDF